MPLNSKEDQIAAFTYVSKLYDTLALDDFNYKILAGWIRTHAGDDWSPNNLMVAVKELWPKLNKEKPAAPEAAPAGTSRILGSLKNGEPNFQ